jgi:PKD repeat protein
LEDKANGGNVIGLGKNILSPFIYKTDSFFVEAARTAKPSVMDNGFNGNAIVSGSLGNNGGFLDFATGKATITLDNMTFRIKFKLPGTGYRLYYRNGGYSGFERDSTKWQILKHGVGKFTVDSSGSNYFLTVENLNLVLTANTKYSFYFTTDSVIQGNDIFSQIGSYVKTNDELTISGGAICWGLFGSRGIYANYTIDVRVGYKRSCPSSSRAKVVVTVVPSPAGATLLKGTPFKGVYNAGTFIDPDAASETRTISYELLPPTKFSNFTYGTNWKISSLTMSTINGTPIPSVDTIWSLPSAGNGNGKLSYTPSIGWGDSTIVIIVNIYDISLACDSVLERYIIVAPTPIPDFISSDVCLGMNIEFVNKSTISSGLMKYYWDFDDGNFSDNQSPIHLYSKSGLYKVRLTVTSNLGIVNDTVIVVNVFDLPEIKFSVKNECEGVDLSFENLTTVSTGTLSYVWSFGDGQTSTATSPSHLYVKPGSYKVTLVASANRCLSSLSKNANQFARPKAAFNTSGVCSGKEVTFINTSTIGLGEKVGTIWNYGDGEFGTLTIQKHIYATAGTKNVKMYAVSQFGCKDSASKNLVVKPSPIANFSYDKICDIDPVNFSNSTTEPAGIPVVYNWEFGDGEVSILKSPTHKYNALGPKKITLVATGANGCFTQIDKNVEVLAQPIAAFEVSSVCANEQITFVNKSKVSKGEMQYNWTFGDGNSSNDFSPKKVYNPATSTTYTVVLETTVLGGCSDKETKSVDIKEKPKCGFTAKVSPNDRLTWTFTPNDNSYGPKAYTWVFVGSNISNDISPTHTFDYYDIQYRVILSVLTSEGCHCLDSGFYLTTSWGVGIQNQKLQSVPILYPNPSNGLMTLEISDWTLKEQTTLTVFDATGRVVKILDITDTHTDKQIIDLSDMASGLYNLNVACISWPSKTFKVLLSR